MNQEKETINKLLKTTKELVLKDRILVVFLMYYTLLNTKDILTYEGVNSNYLWKFLKRPLKHNKNKDGFVLEGYGEISNSFKLNDIEEVISSINTRLNIYKEHSEEMYLRVKENWEVIGLKELQKIYKTNKKLLNKIIKEIDSIDNLCIEDIIDFYEMINISGRTLNDFFTPNDISKLLSKINHTSLLDRYNKLKTQNKIKDIKDFEKKYYPNGINIYDCSCGIGRLLFHTFYELKSTCFKNINVFGIDIYEPFGVLTSSLFNLINPNRTFIVIGNTLLIEPKFPLMDIIVGNPPFGKTQLFTMDNILLKEQYLNSDTFKKLRKEELIQKLKPLNNETYKDIINNYKIV